jgi:hypothetical protein
VSARPARRKAVVRTGRYGAEHGGRWSSPWVIRGVVLVAAAILVFALVYAAAHGFLFAVPSR